MAKNFTIEPAIPAIPAVSVGGNLVQEPETKPINSDSRIEQECQDLYMGEVNEELEKLLEQGMDELDFTVILNPFYLTDLLYHELIKLNLERKPQYELAYYNPAIAKDFIVTISNYKKQNISGLIPLNIFDIYKRGMMECGVLEKEEDLGDNSKLMNEIENRMIKEIDMEMAVMIKEDEAVSRAMKVAQQVAQRRTALYKKVEAKSNKEDTSQRTFFLHPKEVKDADHASRNARIRKERADHRAAALANRRKPPSGHGGALKKRNKKKTFKKKKKLNKTKKNVKKGKSKK